MTNKITELQNTCEIIDKLSAQRNLYEISKRFSKINFHMSVTVVILICLSKLIFTDCSILFKISSIYGVAIVLLRYIVIHLRDKKRNLAARIQQMIDIELFGLTWNSVLCDAIPTHSEIYDYKKKSEGLKDWYPICINGIERSYAVLICQNTNMMYDKNLRNRFLNTSTCLCVMVIVICLIISFVRSLNIWDVFMLEIIPLQPLITWYFDLRKEIIRDISTIEKTEGIITKEIKNIEERKEVSEQNLQVIQDLIFKHRKQSFLIPTFFYNWFRNKSEEQMNYSAIQICNIIKKDDLHYNI